MVAMSLVVKNNFPSLISRFHFLIDIEKEKTFVKDK